MLAVVMPASFRCAHGAVPDNETTTSSPANSLMRDASVYKNSPGVDLYLVVHINHASQGHLAHFRKRGGRLYASHYALKQLGFVLPPGTPNPVAMKSLAGVHVDYDATTQTLDVTAPLSMLNLGTTRLSSVRHTKVKATASPGLLLNYDLHAVHGDDGGAQLNAFSEQRAFGPLGAFSNTLLTKAYDSDEGWHEENVRLDTYWQSHFTKQMITVTAGDTLTGALPWTRSTRMGGLTISRDFSLQPYRTTIPLQSFLGKAVMPSQVQLYINGIRQYSGQVPAGPFDLSINPDMTGAANARMVVTNALGQVSTLNYQFYSANELLQAGLSDWSATLGYVRQNYGINSFDYGDDLAFDGFYRYGLTRWLTGAAQLQATNGLVNTGLGGNWLLGDYGAMDASLAVSHTHDMSGQQMGLGYSWQGQAFGLGFNVRKTNDDYRDTGSLYGSEIPESSANAYLSFSPMQTGRFNLSYIALRYPGQNALQYLSASWFKVFSRNFSFGLNFSRSLDQDDFAAGMVLTWFPSSNTTLFASVDYQNSNYTYNMGASHPSPSEGGLGWRVQATEGAQQGGYAQVGYLGRHGNISGGVNALDGGSRYFFADADGSLILMNDELFAARHIYQAFAVVSTNGVANVPVTYENSVMGKTDDSGNLLVTQLLPWQKNHIGINTLQLSANMMTDKVKAIAVPRAGSGILVEFPIHAIRAATVLLVDAKNQPLPAGSIAYANGGEGRDRIVGYGGVAYFNDLKRENTLDVTTPAGKHCRVRFSWHGKPGEIPQIGPLSCNLRH